MENLIKALENLKETKGNLTKQEWIDYCTSFGEDFKDALKVCITEGTTTLLISEVENSAVMSDEEKTKFITDLG